MGGKIEKEELDTVAGGYTVSNPTIQCINCKQHRPVKEVVVRKEKVSCGVYRTYYKCPNCNEEWTSDYYSED